MKLTTQEVELFYKLMWSLQHFANQRLGIVPGIATIEEYGALPSDEKLRVRNALYEHPEIIDEYVKENPEGYGEDKLEIVRSWKKFQSGDYFIERVLQKYAVFIGGNKVYGVVGLHDEIGDVVPYVPFYCRAVLLPFKGRIIYDGLLEGYRVSFGAGIKRNLKETYMAAKQQGKIIVSFDAAEQQKGGAEKKKKTKNWSPMLDEMAQEAKKLRSGRGEPAIHSPAFSVVRASIEFARIAVEEPENTEQLWKAFKRVERAARKVETVLYRMGYF
jgi:hypothetical protein